MLGLATDQLGTEEADHIHGNRPDTAMGVWLEEPLFFDGPVPVLQEVGKLKAPLGEGGTGPAHGVLGQSERIQSRKECSSIGKQSSREECPEEMEQSQIGSERDASEQGAQELVYTVDYGGHRGLSFWWVLYGNLTLPESNPMPRLI